MLGRRLRPPTSTTLSETAFAAWFGAARPVGLDGDDSRSACRTSSRARGSRATSATSSRQPRSAARAGSSTVRFAGRRGAARDRGGRGRARLDAPAGSHGGSRPASGDARHELPAEVHVRPLRDRLVEPLRPRRGARGGRGAGPGLQPALHLRRRPAWGKPTSCRRSATTSRPARRASRARYVTVRGVHERVHRRSAATSASTRSRRATAHVRRPARRRHPVPRRARSASRRSSSTPSTALYETGKQIVLSSDRPAEGDRRRSRNGCARASSGA